MSHSRSSRHFVSAVSLATVVVLVMLNPLAHAEGAASKEARLSNLRARVRADVVSQSNDGKEQYSQEELEKLRSSLLDLAGSVKDFMELAPASFDAGRLDEATTQIMDLSYEQLTTLRKALKPSKMGEKLAGVRASVAEFKATVQSQSAVSKPKKGGISPASTPFPSSHPFCKLVDGTEETTRIPVAVLLAADVVYFLAETARDLAQDGCNEVLVVLGEGGNARALCVITDGIYIAAHAVWEGIHFCNEEFTDATVDGSYERLGHIHEDLASSVENDNNNKTEIINNDNSNKTEIVNNDNSNKTAIINNDNSNKTSIINNDNANFNALTITVNANTTSIINNDNANKNELRDLILRTQIEADLAEVDSATPVALYLTPTANGGYLNLVQTIVTQTLANIQAAGGSTGQAQSFLNQANAAKAAGDFKGAYSLYRKAYKMAAK